MRHLESTIDMAFDVFLLPRKKTEYCTVFLLTQNRDEHRIGGKSLFRCSVACTFLGTFTFDMDLLDIGAKLKGRGVSPPQPFSW